jgi:hypothetical protein
VGRDARDLSLRAGSGGAAGAADCGGWRLTFAASLRCGATPSVCFLRNNIMEL